MSDKQGIELIVENLELLSKFDREEPYAGLCNEALAAANELRAAIQSINASLALPADTKPADIAKAVDICSRRCEQLEHAVIRAETQGSISAADQLAMMEARMSELEAVIKGKSK